MPLNGIYPRERFPKCIVIKPLQGVVLNAVGLSGPGARALLDSGMYRKHRAPFALSFMAVGATPQARALEYRTYAKLLDSYKTSFGASFALTLNFTCPNTGHDLSTLANECKDALTIFDKLRIPLIAKFNLLTPMVLLRDVAALPMVDALCMTNSIPWGTLEDKIPWAALFGSLESPLAHYGGGGLSGAPLFPLVRDWVVSARQAGIMKPIIACGGILTPENATELLSVGASAVEIGSAAILRPWRVADIIAAVHEYRSVSNGPFLY